MKIEHNLISFRAFTIFTKIKSQYMHHTSAAFDENTILRFLILCMHFFFLLSCSFNTMKSFSRFLHHTASFFYFLLLSMHSCSWLMLTDVYNIYSHSFVDIFSLLHAAHRSFTQIIGFGRKRKKKYSKIKTQK